MENMLADAIMPRLPEVRIRRVPTRPGLDKVVYVVWVPESWAGPHMVTAYDDHRYYRRAQFRTERMAEHLVRGAYARAQIHRERAADFLDSRDLRVVDSEMRTHLRARFVAIPALLAEHRYNLASQELLDELSMFWRNHAKSDFVLASFGAHSQQPEMDSGQPYARLYESGAVVVYDEFPTHEIGERTYALQWQEEVGLWLRFLHLCKTYYSLIHYMGAVSVSIRNDAQGHTISWFPIPGGSARRHKQRGQLEEAIWLRATLDVSAADIVASPERVAQALLDRYGRHFGLAHAGQANVDVDDNGMFLVGQPRHRIQTASW